MGKVTGLADGGATLGGWRVGLRSGTSAWLRRGASFPRFTISRRSTLAMATGLALLAAVSPILWVGQKAWAAPGTIASAPPAPADQARWNARARAMLAATVNMPTVAGRGQVPVMARYLADQFRSGGFDPADIHIMPHDGTAALIVRWRAAKPTRRPILLMAHMDVVEAKPEDWKSGDPFTFVEKDGYYYGRGVLDIKSGVVSITTALLQLRAQGFQPDRDLVVFFSGDEETDGRSAELAASDWRALIDVEYGLNADGGGGAYTTDGRPLGFSMQTAEKTYAQYTFSVTNPGGHSSRPRPDNAIYQLAHGLVRLEAYSFTPMQNETTRAYFEQRQKLEPGPLGDAMRAWLANPADRAAADTIEASPVDVGLTRTRCVATRLAAGHADNALPQSATAAINCRIMPGVDPNAVLAELKTVVAAVPQIVVTRNDAHVSSLASPLRPDVTEAYTKAVRALHPEMIVMPQMSQGASDARPFRVAGTPVYGVSGAWVRLPEDARAHGQDERLPVKALSDSLAHWLVLIREVAGG